MTMSNKGLPCNARILRPWNPATLLLASWLLAACGGGGEAVTELSSAAACDPSNSATAVECGTVILGLTDADGDFLSYGVDVTSIELEMANGRTIEVLPAGTRIDFAQYVDLTEIMTAAAVPPGTYVAGSITLDYSKSEIFVAADGAAKEAVVVDADGNAWLEATLRILLDGQNRLVVTRGRASFLTVDFDLAASHEVDVVSTPAIATAEPFIVAEIDPVEQKEIRVRGPLIGVNANRMTYSVLLRPFYDREGDFGRLDVHITDETGFEVNERLYTGTEGLRALEAAGTGTPTVAQGTLNVVERLFTADVVLAGSSVPGAAMDAVNGNVIARVGNELIVRGGTVIRRDAPVFFRDDVLVTVGPDTKVFKRGHDAPLDAGAISTGQRVTVRGNVTVNDPSSLQVDATQGAVRLHVTQLSGLAKTVMPGQLDIDLHSIDRRRVGVFDFSGTGASEILDADPDNYEVATGPLSLDQQASGRPVVVYGFPAAFGMAPPDFEGRTVIDFSDVQSALGIAWGTEGTRAPFLSLGNDGLLLDHRNGDIGERHYIKQGPVLIDLTSLDSGTLIAPRQTGRALYTIKTAHSLQQYTDFAEFSVALSTALDGFTHARSLYARGLYEPNSNVFTAFKIGVDVVQQ